MQVVGQVSSFPGDESSRSFHSAWRAQQASQWFLIYSWISHLRYGGNRTRAGANPHLIWSATLTTRPTEYIRLVLNVPITCDGNVRYQSYILGWSNGKVADRMRWGFAPAWVRLPPYLKCKIHHSTNPLPWKRWHIKLLLLIAALQISTTFHYYYISSTIRWIYTN